MNKQLNTNKSNRNDNFRPYQDLPSLEKLINNQKIDDELKSQI